MNTELAYKVLRRIVLDEYPGDINHIVATWTTTTTEEREAVAELEAAIAADKLGEAIG